MMDVIEHVLARFRSGNLFIELILRRFHLCCPGYTHGQYSKKLETRDDGAPACLTALALYFEFLNGGAYDNGAA